jgi:hypothetical protein
MKSRYNMVFVVSLVLAFSLFGCKGDEGPAGSRVLMVYRVLLVHKVLLEQQLLRVKWITTP